MRRPIALALLLVGFATASPVQAEIICPDGIYFGAPVAAPTGRNPLYSVAVDFDKDGDLDLAVTNSDYQGSGSFASVTMMKNDGFGGFIADGTYPVPREPHGIVAEDFNEDGIFDLAVACKAANRIVVLRGLGSGTVGDGTFATAVEYVAPGGPFELVTGDFNGDGIADLAAAQNTSSGVVVLRGLGTGGVGNGTFGASMVAALTDLSTGIVRGDFTGDGILDLIATENFDGTIALLRGLGTNSTVNAGFAAAVHIATGIEPWGITVFDYDEDGIRDLAIARASNGGTRVMRGGPGGTFTTVTTLPTGNTLDVAVLDVNEDGIADLISAENTTTATRRLHTHLGLGSGGVGDGSFVAAGTLTLPSAPYKLHAAPLDGDATLDLVVTEFLTDGVQLFRGGCGGPLPDPRYPRLTDVRDVPADEGGRVYLTWLRSSLDVIGGAVQSYRVWRRVPEAEATAGDAATIPVPERMERVETGPGGETFVTFWEHLATLQAERMEGYGYAAATTEDSTAERPVQTAFFVTAATANIDVFYPSNVDSGASIDNIAPETPLDVRAAEVASDGRALVWASNDEPDLDGYRIERSWSPAFAPGEVVVVATVLDTEYVDTDVAAGASYRVIAIDHSGNASPPSAVVTFGAVGVLDIPRLALAGTMPHPARGGSLRISFTLATADAARLELFDAAGRRVAAPSLDGLGAGAHSVALDRTRPLASGVYWARLTQGDARAERRIVVVD